MIINLSSKSCTTLGRNLYKESIIPVTDYVSYTDTVKLGSTIHESLNRVEFRSNIRGVLTTQYLIAKLTDNLNTEAISKKLQTTLMTLVLDILGYSINNNVNTTEMSMAINNFEQIITNSYKALISFLTNSKSVFTHDLPLSHIPLKTISPDDDRIFTEYIPIRRIRASDETIKLFSTNSLGGLYHTQSIELNYNLYTLLTNLLISSEKGNDSIVLHRLIMFPIIPYVDAQTYINNVLTGSTKNTLETNLTLLVDPIIFDDKFPLSQTALSYLSYLFNRGYDIIFHDDILNHLFHTQSLSKFKTSKGLDKLGYNYINHILAQAVT